MKKPRLRFIDIWNMSFGFLGIQFGFALQNANASRILQNLGADVHQLSWFWLVAPITGMIVHAALAWATHKLWRRQPRCITHNKSEQKECTSMAGEHKVKSFVCLNSKI